MTYFQKTRKIDFEKFFDSCINVIESYNVNVMNKNTCLNDLLKFQQKSLSKTTKKKFKNFSAKKLNETKINNLYRGVKPKLSNINKRTTLSQILLNSGMSYKDKKENDLSKNNNENHKIIKNLSQQFSADEINIDVSSLLGEGKKKLNYKNLMNNNENLMNTKKNFLKKNDKPSSPRNDSEKSKNILPQIKTLSLKNAKSILPKKKTRYDIFKAILIYLESNDITLSECATFKPFQHKPYEISSGYEFLEAVKFKNYEFVIQALQKTKRFLFVFDYFGQTGYHWAAKLDDLRMLKTLMSFGKHHNQLDFKGRTPLYLAALNNHKEMCYYLIDHNANIHFKDKNDKSAVDVARDKDLKYYLTEQMSQSYSNSYYKMRVAALLRQYDEKIEKKKQEKLEKEKLKREQEQNEEAIFGEKNDEEN